MPEIFALVAEFGRSLGIRKLKTGPGCWTREIDGHWTVVVNPDARAVDFPGNPAAFPLPADSIYFEFNGWPAGIIGRRGGLIRTGELTISGRALHRAQSCHRAGEGRCAMNQAAKLRAAFTEGGPLWYVAAFLLVVIVPAALVWIALVFARGLE